MKKSCVGKYHLFMFAFMLYFIPKYFEYTTFANYENVQSFINVAKTLSYLLAIVIFVVKMVKERKMPAFFFVVLLTAIIYFSYQGFVKDRKNIFVVLIFAAIFEKQFFDKFIKAVLKTSIALYLTTIISCYLGIIENVFTTRTKFGDYWTAGGTGFGYPGQMIMMLIPIVFMYYYQRRGKINLFENFVWIIIDCLVFSQCLTIMGFVLILLFIISFNILEYKIKRHKKLLLNFKGVKYFPFICVFITIGLLWVYKDIPKVGTMLDVVMNGRLNLGNVMIANYGVKLFGTEFVNNTNYGYYEILDSEYMQMLVGEGVLYLIIAIFLCYLILKYTQRNRETYITLIWVFVLFNAIFNNGIFNLIANPFGILLVICMRDNFRKNMNYIISERNMHDKETSYEKSSMV